MVIGLRQDSVVFLIGFDHRFSGGCHEEWETLWGHRLFLAVLMLMGAGSLLSACDTVAGAGQDISWFGNAVTGDAVQTERAAPPPPPPY